MITLYLANINVLLDLNAYLALMPKLKPIKLVDMIQPTIANLNVVKAIINYLD
jgi:hypothetical protein